MKYTAEKSVTSYTYEAGPFDFTQEDNRDRIYKTVFRLWGKDLIYSLYTQVVPSE